MEIKIQSIKFIKPSKSTPENLRNFKLSLLDQLAPPSYINIILYYKSKGEVNTSDICTKLVKSLSKVLTLFHPLAGRITEDGLMVDCSDQGVKYLETQVSSRLDDFLKQGPKIELINQLIGAPETTLVTIQVNVFDCGGLVIGVSGSHKVTDTCNLVRFINEWASTNHTGTSNGDFYPCFDNLASIFPTRDISSSSVNYSPITNDLGARIVTKRFVFDGTMIYKLRANADSPSGKHKHSRVVLVTSLIWKALICIDKFKSRSFRDCLLAPALNLRGKVDLPISENSFGNVWAPYPVRLKQNEMESKFVDLVTLLEDTTRNSIKWFSKASSEEICTQARACYAEAVEEIKQNKFCICTSWCRFPIYEADFGWGKPYWASSAGRSMEMVALMDSKHGDGIEAWVSLNEKDMSMLEQDEDILAFTS